MFYNKEDNRYDSDSDDSRVHRRRKRKEINIELPQEILVFENPDKINHESYQPGQNPVRFPTPFRCCILGQVNSGKSLVCKNIILARQCQHQINLKKFMLSMVVIHRKNMMISNVQR